MPFPRLSSTTSSQTTSEHGHQLSKMCPAGVTSLGLGRMSYIPDLVPPLTGAVSCEQAHISYHGRMLE